MLFINKYQRDFFFSLKIGIFAKKKNIIKDRITMEKYTKEELLEMLPTDVRDSKELTTKQKIVLGQLLIYNGLDMVKKNGYFYRSNRDLCSDCDIQENTLITTMRKLEMLNLIQRKKGDRKSGASEYRVNEDRIMNYHDPDITANYSNNTANCSTDTDIEKDIEKDKDREKEIEVLINNILKENFSKTTLVNILWLILKETERQNTLGMKGLNTNKKQTSTTTMVEDYVEEIDPNGESTPKGNCIEDSDWESDQVQTKFPTNEVTDVSKQVPIGDNADTPIEFVDEESVEKPLPIESITSDTEQNFDEEELYEGFLQKVTPFIKLFSKATSQQDLRYHVNVACSVLKQYDEDHEDFTDKMFTRAFETIEREYLNNLERIKQSPHPRYIANLYEYKRVN